MVTYLARSTGSTLFIALAYDMIQLGCAERVVVIAGDNASSDALMPWLGNGFCSLETAACCDVIKLATLPSDEKI